MTEAQENRDIAQVVNSLRRAIAGYNKSQDMLNGGFDQVISDLKLERRRMVDEDDTAVIETEERDLIVVSKELKAAVNDKEKARERVLDYEEKIKNYHDELQESLNAMIPQGVVL